MSFLLAIETATEALSIALFSDKCLVAEAAPKTEVASHCERLLPEIDSLLKKNGVAVRELGALALDTGPGSFTSLRVGLATGMGLGLERGLPVYPVSSLEALAVSHSGDERYVAVVLPAGRGMIYGAVFEKAGDVLKPVVAESSFFPEPFAEQLKSFTNLFVVDRSAPTARSVGVIALSDRIPPSPISSLQIRYLKEPDFGRP